MANTYTTTLKRQGPPEKPEGYKGRWPMNWGHALKLHWYSHNPEPESQRSSEDILEDMRRLNKFQTDLLDVEDNLDEELTEAYEREEEESEREEAPAGFTSEQWKAVLAALATLVEEY